MEDIKRILVVSRWTDDCKKAIHYGISCAKMLKARLTILQVEHDPLSLRAGALLLPSLRQVEEEYKTLMVQVKQEVDAIIQQEKAQGLAIKQVVKDADPVQEIVKFVQAEKIDLLIMAAHDETRMEHIFYGRTNHEIVRRMPCSVFLVRGDDSQ
jgi:universal stress protein A